MNLTANTFSRLTTTLAICLFAFQITAHTSAQPTPEASIRGVMDAQVKAWNSGNIREFMQGYWESDSLRFASGGTVKRGWKTTLERYLKSYPDAEAMGKLTFSDLEITILSADAALVFGKWKLQRSKDTPGGLFTLTFRKTVQGWKITQDHTSSN